ncbi:MAG TPA: hypothetical protein VG106_02000, partial [Vicinamibacterales bacterium]|nr:hypothetical protein [Vicinamibacterales bacterium]
MRSVLCVAALAASIAIHVAGGPLAQARAIVLDNVRIVDGSGGAAIERGRIVIEGDRITRVGTSASTAAPRDAEAIDLAGRTI